MENVSENPMVIDGEPPGTWMAVVSLRERWTKLALRMGIGSVATAWLFYLQFQNNAPIPYMLWGFGVFAVGTFLGVRAFGIRERRVFDTTETNYTHTQRIKRAAPWLGLGIAMLVIIWWVQVSSEQFYSYWWYAWPALFPMLVGLGLYLLRSERALSATGQHARAQLDATQAQVTEQRNARLGAIAGSGLVRYAGAAGCLYVAFYLATESTGKNTGWAALIWVIFALILARELGMWLLGIAVVIGIGWALFAGVAALPLSAAVIIGALIIASAIGKS